MLYRYMDSPLGRLLLVGEAGTLHYIGFPEGKGKLALAREWQLDENCCAEAGKQLQEYFCGERKHFDLQLAPSGTAFQRAVLDALREIPWGETRSYSEIAQHIGRPAAVRAVGAANGRNPLPIVLPCHRVIGANGDLTGFGGGMAAKRWLLDLEGALPS